MFESPIRMVKMVNIILTNIFITRHTVQARGGGQSGTFNLDLDNIYQCMVTRVVDRSTVR